MYASQSSLSTNVKTRRFVKEKIPTEIAIGEYEPTTESVTHDIQNRKSNRLSRSTNNASSDDRSKSSNSPTSNDSRYMKKSDSYKDLTTDTLSPRG